MAAFHVLACLKMHLMPPGERAVTILYFLRLTGKEIFHDCFKSCYKPGSASRKYILGRTVVLKSITRHSNLYMVVGSITKANYPAETRWRVANNIVSMGEFAMDSELGTGSGFVLCSTLSGGRTANVCQESQH